jgi:hypothetical protein
LIPLLAAPGAMGGQATTSHAIVLEAPDSHGCPVGFSARHAGAGETVQTGPGSRNRRQGYEISLMPKGQHVVAQAQVTLHGLSGAGAVPAGQGSAHSADTSESFHLVLTPGQGHVFRSTVYTETLAGVLWVELNKLTYADGATWHESANDACGIRPEGFLLVAKRN